MTTALTNRTAINVTTHTTGPTSAITAEGDFVGGHTLSLTRPSSSVPPSTLSTLMGHISTSQTNQATVTHGVGEVGNVGKFFAFAKLSSFLKNITPQSLEHIKQDTEKILPFSPQESHKELMVIANINQGIKEKRAKPEAELLKAWEKQDKYKAIQSEIMAATLRHDKDGVILWQKELDDIRGDIGKTRKTISDLNMQLKTTSPQLQQELRAYRQERAGLIDMYLKPESPLQSLIEKGWSWQSAIALHVIAGVSLDSLETSLPQDSENRAVVQQHINTYIEGIFRTADPLTREGKREYGVKDNLEPTIGKKALNISLLSLQAFGGFLPWMAQTVRKEGFLSNAPTKEKFNDLMTLKSAQDDYQEVKESLYWKERSDSYGNIDSNGAFDSLFMFFKALGATIKNAVIHSTVADDILHDATTSALTVAQKSIALVGSMMTSSDEVNTHPDNGVIEPLSSSSSLPSISLLPKDSLFIPGVSSQSLADQSDEMQIESLKNTTMQRVEQLLLPKDSDGSLLVDNAYLHAIHLFDDALPTYLSSGGNQSMWKDSVAGGDGGVSQEIKTNLLSLFHNITQEFLQLRQPAAGMHSYIDGVKNRMLHILTQRVEQQGDSLAEHTRLHWEKMVRRFAHILNNILSLQLQPQVGSSSQAGIIHVSSHLFPRLIETPDVLNRSNPNNIRMLQTLANRTKEALAGIDQESAAALVGKVKTLLRDMNGYIRFQEEEVRQSIRQQCGESSFLSGTCDYVQILTMQIARDIKQSNPLTPHTQKYNIKRLLNSATNKFEQIVSRAVLMDMGEKGDMLYETFIVGIKKIFKQSLHGIVSGLLRTNQEFDVFDQHPVVFDKVVEGNLSSLIRDGNKNSPTQVTKLAVRLMIEESDRDTLMKVLEENTKSLVASFNQMNSPNYGKDMPVNESWPLPTSLQVLGEYGDHIVNQTTEFFKLSYTADYVKTHFKRDVLDSIISTVDTKYKFDTYLTRALERAGHNVQDKSHVISIFTTMFKKNIAIRVWQALILRTSSPSRGIRHVPIMGEDLKTINLLGKLNTFLLPKNQTGFMERSLEQQVETMGLFKDAMTNYTRGNKAQQDNARVYLNDFYHANPHLASARKSVRDAFKEKFPYDSFETPEAYRQAVREFLYGSTNHSAEEITLSERLKQDINHQFEPHTNSINPRVQTLVESIFSGMEMLLLKRMPHRLWIMQQDIHLPQDMDWVSGEYNQLETQIEKRILKNKVITSDQLEDYKSRAWKSFDFLQEKIIGAQTETAEPDVYPAYLQMYRLIAKDFIEEVVVPNPSLSLSDIEEKINGYLYDTHDDNGDPRTPMFDRIKRYLSTNIQRPEFESLETSNDDAQQMYDDQISDYALSIVRGARLLIRSNIRIFDGQQQG